MKEEVIDKNSKRIIIIMAIIVMILILMGIFIYKMSKKVDKNYGIHDMPYTETMDSIGSDICFSVSALGAEHGEISITYSDLLFDFLGDISKYADIIQKMQTIANEIKYNDNLKKTDEIIVPAEANGISADLSEYKQTLQMYGVQWNSIENVGMYIWKSRYRYYFAEKDSQDIFLLLRCDQFIVETRIYQENNKAMGYEMKWFQVVKG